LGGCQFSFSFLFDNLTELKLFLICIIFIRKKMNKTLLKSNLHKMIDRIENQTLLEDYYKEMKIILEKSQDSVWDKLTDDQKKDVLLSYEESEVDKDLIDNKLVMNKYKDWQ